jgi:broad specificity phosphatase PhoE
MQKWPNSITFIRHGASRYNLDKPQDHPEKFPDFAPLRAKYDEEFAQLDAEKVATGIFPSKELREMAIKLVPQIAPEFNDFDTPLSDEGMHQAITTGRSLPGVTTLPAAIYVSPYLRTQKTLEGLIEGWPQLGDVKVVEDDRIREHEHGKKPLYNVEEVFYTLNPQEALMKKLSSVYEHKFDGGESIFDVKQRTRSFIEMVIREHGGGIETFKDLLIEKTEGTILGDVLEKLRVTSDTRPEDIMVITHNFTILSMRANLERWTREDFLKNKTTQKPVNCGVTIYRGQKSEMNGHGGKKGKLVLDPKEFNMKLY